MTDRGRVPFALVAVLLLVASASLSATLAPRAPPATEPAVERAVERATAQTQTAIRAAVHEAAREAALHPVLVRANTTVGRQLDAARPFRDALRLRIYLAARTRLNHVDERVADVRARATLPRPDERSVDVAIGRVHLSRVGSNDTAMAVRIQNVTIEAHRGGRLVERITLSPRLVIRTPILSVHRRVERFDRLIDRGPIPPGLGRRLTAQLYPIAWARGYAQHSGAPVANVVTNRHVELATNRGLIGLQRRVFGRSDTAARRGMARATARVASRDLLAGSDMVDRKPVEGTDATVDAAAPEVLSELASDGPRPETPLRVGVNLTADRAYASMIDSADANGLEAVLGGVYGAEARLTSAVYRIDTRRDRADRPSGWTLVDERQETTHRARSGPGPTPPAVGDWHRLRTYTRVVRVRTETVRQWRRDNRTRTTRSTTSSTYRVGIAVVGRHATTPHAPDHPIATVHERGAGPLSGPNLAGIPDAAASRLVGGRGGADAIAERAVAGTLDGDAVRISGREPAGLTRWIRQDLADLRERVRNLTVAPSRGAIGTYEANPPAALRQRLSARRERLVDAPAEYGSVADKARIAARGAYLDRVEAELARRAAGRRGRAGRIDTVLRSTGGPSLQRVRGILDARRSVTDERATGLRLEIDADPAYLTQAAVDRSEFGPRSGEIHPLVARNLNVFTAPYGDAADQVIDSEDEKRQVDVRTAAATLRAASGVAATVPEGHEERVAGRRQQLRMHLDASTRRMSDRLVDTLGRADVGATPAVREAIVGRALARWPTPAGRALALANGSAGRAVVAEADRSVQLSDRRRDELRVRVRLAVARSLRRDPVRPSLDVVNRTATATRQVALEVLREGTARATERGVERARRRALGRSLGAVPAGLPVAPVPGYWYATVNLWHVQVRGRYERFVVRTPRGPPGETLTYVRDGRPVKLDVDGDDHRERLGRAERVSFATGTAVVVIVPPASTGVGDTDGEADERSPGWPTPGPSE